MDIIRAITDCVNGKVVSLTAIVNTEKRQNAHQADGLIHQYEKRQPDEDLATQILHHLITAEKRGSGLQHRINHIVHCNGGWNEALAKHLLDGLVAAIKSGARLGSAIKDAYNKALNAAEELARNHPVFTAVLVTTVAIGILVLLLPWAVEALGFSQLGPVEGSFAAWWQSQIGDVEAGSFFAFLQRLGMTWAK